MTITEENYLKGILKLSIHADISVTTNEIAALLLNTPASVTDMLKKLSAKELINYQPYKGARLTEQGYKHATFLVRKHRLWKVFLYQSLNIPWEAVQEIAEELEHINSELLIDHLDSFLGFRNSILTAILYQTLRANTP
ncbi:MAG: metal-dependent transcriptional regulator [Saprospiraceae bacterium]|uniref:Transcriptional regulator MntR n=1 Tax=Candidatus Opimibacter skivensis TaxID=2982028 RepID=A0A9D7XMN4_9BACT|nr:metal-dependent transcriptional regulator [Candidatus Opimibacter skivensis]